MSYDYSNSCALLVSTSDKYEDAWRPFFGLIDIYWENHPHNVYLNCETKGYEKNGVTCIYSSPDIAWSRRLLDCLKKIDEEYVFFSLEDAFLLGAVNDEFLEYSYHLLKTNPEVAVCRLKSSSHPLLKVDPRWGEYRVAGNDVGYRLDTQIALWRKEDLISFIDEKESPWQFEELGTHRVKNTNKLFLWHYVDNEFDVKQMVYPYHVDPSMGYG